MLRGRDHTQTFNITDIKAINDQWTNIQPFCHPSKHSSLEDDVKLPRRFANDNHRAGAVKLAEIRLKSIITEWKRLK